MEREEGMKERRQKEEKPEGEKSEVRLANVCGQPKVALYPSLSQPEFVSAGDEFSRDEDVCVYDLPEPGSPVAGHQVHFHLLFFYVSVSISPSAAFPCLLSFLLNRKRSVLDLYGIA